MMLALFFIGIALAFVFLLVATFVRKSDGGRKVLYVLAFLALFAQGGCWHFLSDIGRSTGADGGPDLTRIIVVAAIVAFIWAFLLEWAALKRWAKERHRPDSVRKRSL